MTESKIYLPIVSSESTILNSSKKECNEKLKLFLDALLLAFKQKVNNNFEKNDMIKIWNQSLKNIYQINIEESSKNDSSKNDSSKTICKGKTANGKDCRSNALKGELYCKRHLSTLKQTNDEVKEVKSIKQLKNSLIIKPVIDLNEEDEEELLTVKDKNKNSSLKTKLLAFKQTTNDKKKEEKASDKLIKATELISSKNNNLEFNFEKEKPVNIFNKQFWKTKVYIDAKKDLVMNEKTGLIIELIDSTTVKLYGRSYQGELIRKNNLNHTIIDWCKKSGIEVDEDEGEDDDDEDEDEDDE
jgi:hypothetical protein